MCPLPVSLEGYFRVNTGSGIYDIHSQGMRVSALIGSKTAGLWKVADRPVQES